ncbi:sugar transferase [Leifsonia sp. F6_8S_P_1B]|uniref:Sugar transferase n=1 Tax=Leifsonia williamsii TaxID=3035919 RepID=A0ABT8KFD4_9MICO|nr:sugar transferase [Leifsonia williamsii]MDN4616155.1 sugar transferase [Leifsonia williamsii]
MTRRRPYDTVKRALDIVSAAIVLVVGSPLFALVALLVARNLGRPVLFRQPRPGRDGRVFTLLKFRTMREPRPGEDVSDEARLTRFGRVLRSTSLDELPSLVNVLRGDMSIVGPRPLLVSYLRRYTPEQARRHEVRPGITGLAQVSGRNTVEWSRRFELDVEYVERRSLRLDAWILLQTALAVVRRDGISAEGHATMPEFQPEEVA